MNIKLNTMKYLLIIIIIAIASAGYIYRDNLKTGLLGAASTKQDNKKEKKNKKDQSKGVASPEIQVNDQWNLPGRLKEISGVHYLDAERFACVQDEEGVIFIYNVKKGSIEQEIAFSGAGDYEGLAVSANDAYVVQSDGVLYEIKNWRSNATVKQYKTALTAEHNVEGLFYDQQHNRLLLAIKNDEPGNKDYKGVYAFDLSTKSFNSDPVYKLNVMPKGTGKKNKSIKPSAIARHPLTNELYLLDGPAARLIRIDETGNVKQTYHLGNQFEQPEGLTFSANGELFISNEGVKKPGNIVHVAIK